MSAWRRVPRLGDEAAALAVARRAAAEVPAYRETLARLGLLAPLEAGRLPFAALPALDKASYALAFPLAERTAASARPQLAGLYWSSGTGAPAPWPRLRGEPAGLDLGAWLDSFWTRPRTPVLAVVCMAVDRCTGGASTLAGLQALAASADRRLSVVCAGARHEDAVEAVAAAAGLAELFVFFSYASAVPPLLERLRRGGADLARCRFAVTGDPFPESLRRRVDQDCGVAAPGTALASYAYSSADTRLLGLETPRSVAWRRQGGPWGEPAPMLFERASLDALPLIEEADGAFLVTRWQASPLVRYRLGDRGELWDGPAPLVALRGRELAPYFYGLYATPDAVAEALSAPELAAALTGAFEAEVDEAAGRMRLEVESRGEPAADLTARVEACALAAFGRLSPDFAKYRDSFLRGGRDAGGGPPLEVSARPWPLLSARHSGSRKRAVVRRSA